MSEAVEEERMAKLEKTLSEHDDALFGSWNAMEQRRFPGLIERVNLMTLLIKIIGALVTITAAASLGVPTRELIPAIAKFLLGLH
jgi:hypothetical protein